MATRRGKIEGKKEYPENIRRQVLLRREIRESESSSSYLDRPPFRLEGEKRRKAPRDKNSRHGKRREEVTGCWEEKGKGDNCCIKIANLNECSFRSTGGLSPAQRPLFLNILMASSMIVSPSFQPPPTYDQFCQATANGQNPFLQTRSIRHQLTQFAFNFSADDTTSATANVD